MRGSVRPDLVHVHVRRPSNGREHTDVLPYGLQGFQCKLRAFALQEYPGIVLLLALGENNVAGELVRIPNTSLCDLHTGAEAIAP